MSESTAATQPAVADDPPIVLVVMGVCGTGKSTVGGMLAGRLGWDLEEGDDLHPEANVAKMESGQPLTDEDRWPWLEKVSAWIQLHTGSATPGIVTCSALRRAYRDRLRGPGVAFVHLHGPREVIARRMAIRQDHFMPSTLLDSQLATLEPLEPDEVGIVVELGQTTKEEVKAVMRQLRLDALPPPRLTPDGLLAD